MPVLKNMLENAILKQLALYHALGEVKLQELVMNSEKVNDRDYIKAIYNLSNRKLIEVVADATESMSVIRLINKYH